jgi:hypothetical protein
MATDNVLADSNIGDVKRHLWFLFGEYQEYGVLR